MISVNVMVGMMIEQAPLSRPPRRFSASLCCDQHPQPATPDQSFLFPSQRWLCWRTVAWRHGTFCRGSGDFPPSVNSGSAAPTSADNFITPNLTPLGEDGVLIFEGVLSLNMYNAIGWISAIINLAILLVLVWPGMFCEQRIAGLEATRNRSETSEGDWSKIHVRHLDNHGPVCVEQGRILKIHGALDDFRFDERSDQLLYGGFMLMAMGVFLYVPLGGDHSQLQISEVNLNGTEVLGCPVTTQAWCATIPVMKKEQIVVAYLLYSIGDSVSITLCLALLSKILGARPQGVWIGVKMALSSLSRVIGPIIMSSVYMRLYRPNLDIFSDCWRNDDLLHLVASRANSSRASSCY
ncbi:hypothetical protein B566_EDAN004780 [Ephemera danica]|nr:hypothetical protein B566_EDAN004780 [Ephemera danica]